MVCVPFLLNPELTHLSFNFVVYIMNINVVYINFRFVEHCKIGVIDF